MKEGHRAIGHDGGDRERKTGDGAARSQGSGNPGLTKLQGLFQICLASMAVAFLVREREGGERKRREKERRESERSEKESEREESEREKEKGERGERERKRRKKEWRVSER